MSLGLVLGVDATIGLFRKDQALARRVRRFCSVLFAGIGIAIFFLVQRALNGWFFFPIHVGFISASWPSFWGRFKGCLEVVFCYNLRYLLYSVVLFFSILAAIITRHVKYMLPVVIGLVVFNCVETKLFLPEPIMLVLLICAMLLFAWQLPQWVSSNKATSRFIHLAVCFFISYMLFSSFNFITARYAITLLIIAIILTSVCLDHFIARLHPVVFLLTIVLLVGIGQQGINTNKGFADTDMGAFDGMEVQQDLIKYFRTNKLYNHYITPTNFPVYDHLADPNSGYLRDNEHFTHILRYPEDSTKYVVFDNIEPNKLYDSLKGTYKGKIIYRTEHNSLWGEVYKIK